MSPGCLSPATHTAEEVIRLLGLEPLPQEGGFFRRTLESGRVFPAGGPRTWSAIYFLVTPDGFSALHRLQADELWFFHAGDGLESLRLRPDGSGEWVKLGCEVAAGERLQDVVPAGEWQGTRLGPGGRWALVSTVVAPEFRPEDFDLGERTMLTAAYPAWAGGIGALTRTGPA